MGIQPGDPIGLCAPNSIDGVSVYFGVLKAGAVAVTLSRHLTGNELTYLLDHAGIRELFTSEKKLPELMRVKHPDSLEIERATLKGMFPP